MIIDIPQRWLNEIYVSFDQAPPQKSESAHLRDYKSFTSNQTAEVIEVDLTRLNVHVIFWLWHGYSTMIKCI